MEEKIAEVLEWVISGVTLNEVVDKWRISNVNSPLIVECWYGTDAIYSFQISVDDVIQFYNIHREAKKGIGTQSLLQLENAFQILAKRIKKTILIIFDDFNQTDTRRWLEKNHYIFQEGHFVKQFDE